MVINVSFEIRKGITTITREEIEEKGIFKKIGITGIGTYYILKGHKRGERGNKRAINEQ